MADGYPEISDYDPDIGNADRARKRKDFPRGTGTGQPGVEENPQMGYTQSVGTAANALLGLPSRLVGQALGVPAYTGQTPGEPPPSAIAAPSAPPPAIATPRYVPSSVAEKSVPVTSASFLGPSESVQVPPTGIAGPVMTDAERNNAPFHSAYLALQAQKAGDTASARQDALDIENRNARAAAAPSYRELEMARSAQRVADFNVNNSADVVLRGGTGGEREAALAVAQGSRQRLGALEAGAAAAAAPTQRNYVGEQVAQQAGAANALESGQRRAENELLAPVKYAQGTQQVATSATAQKVADIGLQAHQHRLELQKELATTTDPKRRNALEETIRVIDGKEKADVYQTIHAKGGTNDLGQPLPDTVHIVNTRTGTYQTIGGASPAAGAPPTDGEIRVDPSTGKRGKYDAKAGKWVPA